MLVLVPMSNRVRFWCRRVQASPSTQKKRTDCVCKVVCANQNDVPTFDKLAWTSCFRYKQRQGARSGCAGPPCTVRGGHPFSLHTTKLSFISLTNTEQKQYVSCHGSVCWDTTSAQRIGIHLRSFDNILPVEGLQRLSV